jgi:hypothetical protein
MPQKRAHPQLSGNSAGARCGGELTTRPAIDMVVIEADYETLSLRLIVKELSPEEAYCTDCGSYSDIISEVIGISPHV